MRRWWIWITLLLVMTLGIRLLADSQQASQIRKLHVAHAAVSDAHPTNEDTSTPHDDWRGKTGLSSSDERRFIRYLHLKLGEQDNDPSALQAEDLTYLGAYDQDEGVVRYWLLPPGYSALYGTITRIEGGALVFGLASSPPQDADSTDDGQPMEPDDESELNTDSQP